MAREMVDLSKDMHQMIEHFQSMEQACEAHNHKQMETILDILERSVHKLKSQVRQHKQFTISEIGLEQQLQSSIKQVQSTHALAQVLGHLFPKFNQVVIEINKYIADISKARSAKVTRIEQEGTRGY